MEVLVLVKFDHSKWETHLLQIASDISQIPGFSAAIKMQGNRRCWDSHLEHFAGLAVSKQVDERTFEFTLCLGCPFCNYSLLSLDLQFHNGLIPQLSDQSSLPVAERIQLVFHAVGAPDPWVDRDGQIAASMLSAHNIVNSIDHLLFS